jgi:hypothetical protein
MQGNLQLIIDIVAKDSEYNRDVVEGVAIELFKRWKTRMVHSEAFTLYMPELGYFMPMNNKLRKYVRENVKKVRKQRNRLKLAKETLLTARKPELIEELNKTIEGATMWEGIYLKNLKCALKQLNILRTLYYEKGLRRKERKLKALEDVNT